MLTPVDRWAELLHARDQLDAELVIFLVIGMTRSSQGRPKFPLADDTGKGRKGEISVRALEKWQSGHVLRWADLDAGFETST